MPPAVIPDAQRAGMTGRGLGKRPRSLSAFGLNPEAHAALQLAMGPRVKPEDRGGKAFLLFPREGGDPEPQGAALDDLWIPAFAGKEGV